MALGATRGSVVKMVLREVLILTGFSVAVALPLSVALSGLVRSQLFGISDHDPATLLLVTLAIGTVALLAAWGACSSCDPGSTHYSPAIRVGEMNP